MRAEVVRQEPAARARARERDREVHVVGVDRDGVDREERERDPCERRGEAVHVVEQVERVRHPDEPEDRERPRDDRRVHELHARARREDDHRRGDLRGELHLRRQRVQVVDEARDEEERRPRVDAGELVRRLDRADGDGRPDPDRQPREDADAAEERRRRVVPALGRGDRDEPAAERCREEDPDRERRCGECGDRRDRAHGVRGYSVGVRGVCARTEPPYTRARS